MASFICDTSTLVGVFVLQLILSIVSLLFIGKVLEPIWGSKEFFKFVLIVNIMTYISVFATTIMLYYITSKEIYL